MIMLSKINKIRMLRKEKILGDSMYSYTIVTTHMGRKNIR